MGSAIGGEVDVEILRRIRLRAARYGGQALLRMTLVRGAAWAASGVKPLLRGCGWLPCVRVEQIRNAGHGVPYDQPT